MMKKLVLLTIAGAFSLGAGAQVNNSGSVVLTAHKAQMNVPVNIGNVSIGAQTHSANNSANKGTATGGSRWYNQYDLEYQGGYTGGTLSSGTFVFPIGWDSTQYQFFTNDGWVAVNWIGTAQFIDPIFSLGFNQASTGFYESTDIKVNQATPYTVDSIEFSAAYMKGAAGGAGTIDTLFLSVASVPYDDATVTASDDADVTKYPGVTDHNNELKFQRLNQVDTVTHQLTYSNTISWKVPLSDTLRKDKTTDGKYPTRGYRFEVPGGLNVAAGNGVAISLSFKPGETWNYKDSVQKLHYWMPIVAQSADGAQMPYFYYDYNDHTMSYLMHNAGINRYSASINLELVNSIDFAYEFLRMGALITCPTCWDLGVNNVNSTINKFNAYPNPAMSDINVTYELYKAADVNITVTNAIGQTLKSQTVENTKAGNVQFTVSDLTNGVYFYTVNADGESITRRFVVAH